MNPLSTYIGREPSVCYTQIDDEVIILNPESDLFYRLNSTAAELWLFLDSPKTVFELSHLLAQKYLGTITNYQQDIVDWIQDTAQKGLLLIKDAKNNS